MSTLDWLGSTALLTIAMLSLVLIGVLGIVTVMLVDSLLSLWGKERERDD